MWSGLQAPGMTLLDLLVALGCVFIAVGLFSLVRYSGCISSGAKQTTMQQGEHKWTAARSHLFRIKWGFYSSRHTQAAQSEGSDGHGLHPRSSPPSSTLYR